MNNPAISRVAITIDGPAFLGWVASADVPTADAARLIQDWAAAGAWDLPALALGQRFRVRRVLLVGPLALPLWRSRWPARPADAPAPGES